MNTLCIIALYYPVELYILIMYLLLFYYLLYLFIFGWYINVYECYISQIMLT